MKVAFDEVEAVLAAYFEGLHHSDTAILRRVFTRRRCTPAPPMARC
jgi:Putative lumazine-binding